MIKKMAQSERVEDIAKRSNMSKTDVERVLRAQRESLLASLTRGERGGIAGIVDLTPAINKKLGVGAREIRQLDVKAKASGAIIDALNREVGDADYKLIEEDRKGIRESSLEYLE